MIPAKLKDDAIVEALCQLQFKSTELPEVIVGRLSDVPDARSYEKKTMPVAQIPAPMRRSDPNLMWQPLLQLVNGEGQLLQIGERAVSAHVVGPRKYPGWDSFFVQIRSMVDQLFEKVPDVEIEGMSLRYINALVADRHRIDRPQALNLQFTVGGAVFDGAINLAFVDRENSGFVVTTRIADLSFVQGVLPPGTTAVIDVEVTATKATKNKDAVVSWIDGAHTLEKKAFFRLLPENIVNELAEN